MTLRTTLLLSLSLVTLSAAAIAADGWEKVGPGVTFRHFDDKGRSIYVTKIDLKNDEIRIVSTDEEDRGKTVGAYADGLDAIVAINADYFTAEMKPIGLTVGPCGQWEGTEDTSREGVIAYGSEKMSIRAQKEVMSPPEEWIEAAVSGWPLLVKNCRALTAKELPGSKAFTHSPHPRTAVGVSKSGRYAFFVVAEGRHENVGGLTLPELAKFMKSELGACSAMNLDGGGSSAMWVNDRIVNRPTDGTERKVVNHLAVVLRDGYRGCDQ